MVFHSNWFDPHVPSWEKLLKKFKNKPDLLFLEIGCYEGRATLWLLENILTSPSSKIEVIDTFEGSPEHNKKSQEIKNMFLTFKENISSYLSQNPKKNKVVIHKGESGTVLRKLGSKSKFDFIYIDGSHMAKDVLEDAILCWRLLKKDGIMIFDDYGWRIHKNPLLLPCLAIDSFLRVFQGQYKILNIGYQVAILKKGDNIAIKDSKNEPEFLESGEIGNLKLTIKELNKSLQKIKSSKTYLVWQSFCELRRKLKSVLN